MKRKQAVILSILALSLLVSLTSCVVKYKTYNIDAETVSSIEIFDLGERGSLDMPETPSYTVESDQQADLLSDLSDIQFSDTIILFAANDPSFSFGRWVVRINYTDGSYTLISDGGYGETYDAAEQKILRNHFDCDADEWERFLAKYLPTEPDGTQSGNDEISSEFSLKRACKIKRDML